MSHQRGSTMTEFALAWPLILLLVLVAIQVAVYGVETFTARAAALAGARVGSESGGSAAAAQAAAVGALAPALVGVAPAGWCPGSPASQPRWVWVCAGDSGGAVRVRIGGSVPLVVPLPGAELPIRADVSLAKEVFQP